MNTLFIIGGIFIIAGITYMTILYFKTAGELIEVQERNKELESFMEDYLSIMDEKYEIATEEDARDIRFGGF